MSAKSLIKVSLKGKTYEISGTESKEYMQRIVDYIAAKETELLTQKGQKRMPDPLFDYLVKLNIADDYFKQLKKCAGLDADNARKNKELSDLKRELARSQTECSKLRKRLSSNEEKINQTALSFGDTKPAEGGDSSSEDADIKIAGDIKRKHR